MRGWRRGTIIQIYYIKIFLVKNGKRSHMMVMPGKLGQWSPKPQSATCTYFQQQAGTGVHSLLGASRRQTYSQLDSFEGFVVVLSVWPRNCENR